ncbi:integrase core domain-containing protein, partial [Massilia sp.]|uniref:integrase core domain-containing protein n=1 Tax=Massilia sp. TaxID=1882437 RepID=UPI0028AAA233
GPLTLVSMTMRQVSGSTSDVYLKGYANMAELTMGLAQYFAFYNAERPHQSLGYKTPASVYRSGIGGGALIVDKYSSAEVPELEAA